MAEDQETITFKAPKSFSDRLSKMAFDADVPKSVWIRACIEVASPILKEKPFLAFMMEHTKNGNMGQ